MAINITVGSQQPEEEKSPVVTSIDLKIRRSLNGDYYISDHADIDIIIMKDKKKILAIAKDMMSELVYGAQDRLFDFMLKKGIVVPESIQGGSIYGSMEGALHSSEEYDAVKMAIITFLNTLMRSVLTLNLWRNSTRWKQTALSSPKKRTLLNLAKSHTVSRKVFSVRVITTGLTGFPILTRG